MGDNWRSYQVLRDKRLSTKKEAVQQVPWHSGTRVVAWKNGHRPDAELGP